MPNTRICLSTQDVLERFAVCVDTHVTSLCVVEVIVQITGIGDGYLPVPIGEAG